MKSTVKKALFEGWGFGGEDESEDDGGQQEKQQINTLDAMKPIDSTLNKIDVLYKDIINNKSKEFLYDDNVNNINIKELSKKISTTHNTPNEIEDQLDETFNTNSDVVKMFDSVQVSSERKKRYGVYNDILQTSYIAARTLKVFASNILYRQNKSKAAIINFSVATDNDHYVGDDLKNTYINLMNTITIVFDINKKLKDTIVPKTLTHGNTFVEIINTKNIATQNHLLESSDPFSKFVSYESEKETDLEQIHPNNLNATQKMKNLLESTSFSDMNNIHFNNLLDMEDEDDFTTDKIDELEFNELMYMKLKIHSANKVIIIENDIDFYGYIVIDGSESMSTTEINAYDRLKSAGGGGVSSEKEIATKITDKLVKMIGENINEVKHIDFDSLSDENRINIEYLVYQYIKDKHKVKVRFIQKNKLVNFTTSVDKYSPYGTSVIDDMVTPVKLYSLAMMSSIVSRLSRASVMRKWNVEVGNKQNHAEILNKIKTDIKNKSVTYDKLTDIKNIPEILTDFRDMATIQVNGQRYVDVEILPMGDRALPINDLQDLKAEVVASSGIPAIYLNIADNPDLRESLVNMNTAFASTISTEQERFEDGISAVYRIIFIELLKNNGYKTNFNLMNYIEARLNPPLILQIQSNEALVSSVSNIIGMLQNSGITVDPAKILAEYIPNIDWNTMIKDGELFIKNRAKEELIQQGHQ